MATDDVKKSGGKIWGKRSKAWQLWRVRADGSQIQLVAEGVTRAELNRLHKRRLDWLYKIYYNHKPVSERQKL